MATCSKRGCWHSCWGSSWPSWWRLLHRSDRGRPDGALEPGRGKNGAFTASLWLIDWLIGNESDIGAIYIQTLSVIALPTIYPHLQTKAWTATHEKEFQCRYLARVDCLSQLAFFFHDFVFVFVCFMANMMKNTAEKFHGAWAGVKLDQVASWGWVYF